MGNKQSSGGEARRLWVNCGDNPEVTQMHKVFPDNRVVSAKYSVWTFIPKNLFEQFRRIANFYFLCMAIIQLSIDSPVSAQTSTVPLAFVVIVTAAKQGYEDFLRHRGDRSVNDAPVAVVRRGCVQDVRARDIHVGEVVRVSENQPVPCDLLLLSSSDPTGICYVTTANLDGETNLKTLRCPRTLKYLKKVEDLARFRALVECDPPTPDLYTFHGRLEVLPAGPGPGVMLPGVEGPQRGADPLEISLEKLGEGDKEALDTENLLLRGATVKNTEFVYGCAVYTGQETKLALNSRLTRNKFSTVEKSVNKFLLFFLVLLLVEVAICVGLKYGYEVSDAYKLLTYLGAPSDVTALKVVGDIFSFVVLFNYIIPISLYVTMELQKFLGSLFFELDKEMYSEELDERAICNTSDLNEELGQVEYLFTDKTGTLTENDMVFRRCSVGGTCYEERGGQLLLLGPDGDPRRSIRTLSTLTNEVESFFLAMAVCHSVQVAPFVKSKNKEEIIEYQASSPDEKALVESAKRCGVVFLGEKSDVLLLRYAGREQKYHRLETIEFSSDRKRMSVVVEDSEGCVWLVCKGAESAVLPLCSAGPLIDTLKHVGDFAMRGLRTLVIARRRLATTEWQELRAGLQRARQVVGADRAQQVIRASEALESGLTLLGASGVEDRLQPFVQETLESLRAAGVKVWVLTGDKVETAVNVSFSCGHLKPGTVQLTITEQQSSAECLTTLHAMQARIRLEPHAQFGLVVDGPSLALALKFEPDLLREVSAACSAVLACRLSPLQKCEVVQLIKAAPGRPITAAVGDGANDVSMIQEAHVGLGIVGKEGRQAVRSADFAVPKFHHLRRALLVHGHWYYRRAAILVQYFFYKNAAFITPQVFFAFDSLFSTQPLYDSIFLTLFNVFFTSLPVLVFGLMEQDWSDEVLLERPQLYQDHKRNALLAWPRFIGWTALGLYHAAVLYYVPWAMWANNSAVLWDSSDAGLWCYGTLIIHCAVMVCNLKLWLVSRYWTFLFIASLLFSILFFIAFTAAYSSIFLQGLTSNMYMVYVALLGSLNFWLLSIFLCVACLIPDFTILAWEQMAPRSRISWRSFTRAMVKHGQKSGRVTVQLFHKSTGRLSISSSMHDKTSHTIRT